MGHIKFGPSNLQLSRLTDSSSSPAYVGGWSLSRAKRFTALLLSAIATVSAVQSASAATYNSKEFNALLAEATRKHYVRVMVDLGIKVPLQTSDKHSAALRAALLSGEDAIVNELGNNVLRSTVWRNGLGQIGLYVTPNGLKVLGASRNASSFTRDVTDELRVGVYKADGRLAQIEAEIENNGFADVEITQNLDNFEADLGADGRIVHRSSQLQAAEIATKRPALLNRLPASGVLDLVAAKNRAAGPSNGPTFQLRINKEGFFYLKEDAEIRGLRSVTFPEVVAPYIDPDAFSTARKYGYVDVTIDLQRFSGYSPYQGKLPSPAWKAQDAALKRAFGQILDTVAPFAAASAKYYEGIASVSVRLPRSAIEQIAANADPRIGGVYANKEVGKLALAQSTVMINAPQAWNIGLRGAGQMIAILDSGVDRSHPFLQRADGSSKFINEACASTPPDSLTHDNLCGLTPDSNGDAVGIGAAAPCSFYGQLRCQHGTHVAGIATGRPNGGPTGVNGVAPDADLLPVTVVARNKSTGAIVWFNEDLARALELAWQIGYTNLTVNMSLGSPQLYNLPCDGAYIGYTFTDSVTRLTDLTVPVIAATGNNYSRERIAFPACLNNVIKVGSTDDIAGSGQLSDFTNLVDPAGFGGYFLMAPGATITSSTSYVPGSTVAYPYGDMNGTSQATPHVAGLFAMLKAQLPGYSVASMASYLYNTAVQIASPYSTVIKRVRVEDF